MGRIFKDYGLSIVLAVLFLVSWGIQTWTGWVTFAAEQAAHGQVAQAFGDGGYVWEWAAATMENWQSEFLQLLTFVVLTSFLIHKGSHESKDGDEELKSMIKDVQRRLAKIEKSEVGSSR